MRPGPELLIVAPIVVGVIGALIATLIGQPHGGNPCDPEN